MRAQERPSDKRKRYAEAQAEPLRSAVLDRFKAIEDSIGIANSTRRRMIGYLHEALKHDPVGEWVVEVEVDEPVLDESPAQCESECEGAGGPHEGCYDCYDFCRCLHAHKYSRRKGPRTSKCLEETIFPETARWTEGPDMSRSSRSGML